MDRRGQEKGWKFDHHMFLMGRGLFLSNMDWAVNEQVLFRAIQKSIKNFSIIKKSKNRKF